MAKDVVEPVEVRSAEAVPATPGGWEIWFFILGEMVIFSVYFGVYAYRRGLDASAFRDAQDELSAAVGALNTLILLTSSVFVVLAMRSLHDADRVRARRYVVAAAACGVAFGVVKAFEWSDKIAHGMTIHSSEFSTFYFMLTGIHAGHVALGLGALGLVWSHLGTKGGVNAQAVESAAIYWHLVDLLWIVIFPLLYLAK